MYHFVKHQSLCSNSVVFFPKSGDFCTHPWRGHEDPGDHDLRDGLLRSFRRLSEPVVIFIRYGDAVLELPEDRSNGQRKLNGKRCRMMVEMLSYLSFNMFIKTLFMRYFADTHTVK